MLVNTYTGIPGGGTIDLTRFRLQSTWGKGEPYRHEDLPPICPWLLCHIFNTNSLVLPPGSCVLIPEDNTYKKRFLDAAKRVVLETEEDPAATYLSYVLSREKHVRGKSATLHNKLFQAGQPRASAKDQTEHEDEDSETGMQRVHVSGKHSQASRRGDRILRHCSQA